MLASCWAFCDISLFDQPSSRPSPFLCSPAQHGFLPAQGDTLLYFVPIYNQFNSSVHRPCSAVLTTKLKVVPSV